MCENNFGIRASSIECGTLFHFPFKNPFDGHIRWRHQENMILGLYPPINGLLTFSMVWTGIHLHVYGVWVNMKFYFMEDVIGVQPI